MQKFDLELLQRVAENVNLETGVRGKEIVHFCRVIRLKSET